MMKKMILKIAAFISCVFCFASPDSNTIPRFAFVLGNQRYKESPLKNTVSDARLISEKLKESGFDVTFKTDLDTNMLREEIGLYAEKVGEAGRDSISLFYYAGHGVQVGGVNYLVPIDDEKITTQSMVKAKCYSIKEFLSLIPSKTQVVIMDACRNNPFKTAKESFSKGLTSIEAPANVDFCYLFSTAQGQTASDGNGKNSLFTKVLADRMGQYNVDVTVVFNQVCNDVKEMTGGQQVPNFSGNSVRFEFMNSQIAKSRIDRLNKQMKENLTVSKSSSAEQKKQFDTDKSLMEAEIALMKEKERKAKEDKAKRDEIAAKNDREVKRRQEELARAQENVANKKKENQALKAQNQSSISFIKAIEEDKRKLQQLRSATAAKINAANDETRNEERRKIKAVINRPGGITETDANGNLTSAAKKGRKAEIAQINAQSRLEEQHNFETFYSKIQQADLTKMQDIQNDLVTLKNAVYEASSITDEVKFKVMNYDGAKFEWTVVYDVYMDFQKVMHGSVTIPYVALAKAYGFEVPSGKLTSADSEYNYNCELLDTLLHKEKMVPIILQIEYKVKNLMPGSTYAFKAQKAKIYYVSGNSYDEFVCEKKVSDKGLLNLGSPVILEEVSSIVKKWTKARMKAVKEVSKY